MTEPDAAFSVAMLATGELSEARRSSIIEVCIAAHESEAFRDLFDHFTEARHFLGSRGPELVAHAMVSTRWVQPEGQRELKTAYVDAVSTLPRDQGLGYGSEVMRRLAAEIGDYEVACLQTDEPSFYTRLGWEVWRGPLAGRGDDGGVIPTPEQRGVMVLRLPQTPALDLDAPLSIESQTYRIWE